MWRRSKTIKHKLGLALTVTTGFVGLLSAVSIIAVQSMAGDTGQLYRKNLQGIIALDQASLRLASLQGEINGRLRSARLADLTALARGIPARYRGISKAWRRYYPARIDGEVEKQRARSALSQLKTIGSELNHMSALARSEQFYQAKDFYQNNLEDKLSTLVSTFNSLRHLQLRAARAVFRHTAQSQARLQRAIILAAAAALAVAMLTAFLLAGMITRPLNKARDFADSIAGGRLDNEIEHRATDEFGAMIASLAMMQQQLANLLSTNEQAKKALNASNTELEASNKQLIETEALYRELFLSNPLPLYIVDSRTLQFLEVNNTAQAHYGFERDEFLSMCLRDVEPVTALETADRRRAALKPEQTETGLWRHVTRAGRIIDVELSMYAVQWIEHSAWLIVARDVTRQREAQQMLELRDKAIEASHNGMFICSAGEAQGSICYVNTAMAEFSGQDQAALIGRPLVDLFPKNDANDPAHMVSSLLAGHQAQTLIAAPLNGDEQRWLEAQVTPVPNAQGTPEYWIGVVQDITERKAFEATLAYSADHDDLTGLPNRSALHRCLTSEIATAARTGGEIAVLFLDLDDFKQINDSGGHEAGDVYLRTLAERLTSRIRETDTLARMGGDEFVLVTSGSRATQTLSQVALRLQAAFNDPVTVAGQVFKSSCSIGIACYPNHGIEADTLLRRADLTMYMAKRRGGHAIEWFVPSMETSFRRRSIMESALGRALALQEFELHYQPQIDMRNGSIVGLEALLRWPSADTTYRSPAEFIPVAEDTGQIIAIGTWVLKQACTDLARLRAAGHTTLTMAVNVSTKQLRDTTFIDEIEAVLGACALPADTLEIEITESLFMAKQDQSLQTLNALDALGVRLAIDDFGTGYSSLSYLSRLPLHRLKIDRSFIREMNDSTRASELVRTVAHMAGNLELEALAEGVETEIERQILLDHNCSLAQGFYYSRGLPIDELLDHLNKPVSVAVA